MINTALFLAYITDEADKIDFENLVVKYQKRLHNAAYRILKSNALAEEAVSETFFRIAKYFQKINKLEMHEIEAYLIVTIKSICYQMYNKEKHSSAYLSLDDMVLEPSFDEYDKYDYALLKSEIENLGEKHKTVLVYMVYFGMNADKTAEIMGISRRSVYNYLNEAKARLKRKLGDEKVE